MVTSCQCGDCYSCRKAWIEDVIGYARMLDQATKRLLDAGKGDLALELIMAAAGRAEARKLDQELFEAQLDHGQDAAESAAVRAAGHV